MVIGCGSSGSLITTVQVRGLITDPRTLASRNRRVERDLDESFQDSPIAQQCRQFAVLRPELSKGEQHSEEGLYEKVTWEFWRMATNADGAIEDNVTVRKVRMDESRPEHQ